MGAFPWFGRSTKLKTAVDLSVLKTDVHSHLIPGIDDGVSSLEESLALIETFDKLGYTKLVTTPHIMTDYYRNTPEIINAGLDDLKRMVASKGMNIILETAAEYMVDIGFEDKLKRKDLLTFGRNYVLIEFSYLNPPNHYKQLIFDMRTEGYQVVLAHPERYSYWHQQFDVYEDLCDRGVFLQLNLVSLSGFYGEDVKKITHRMIDKQLYSFAGSDVHNIDYMNAVELSTFEFHLEKMLETNRLLNASL